MELNLKEKIIFAKFKDKPIDDFEIFREKLSEKFGFPLSDNLIRKLKVYQKKKYSTVWKDTPTFSINTDYRKKEINSRKRNARKYSSDKKLEELEKYQKTYTEYL